MEIIIIIGLIILNGIFSMSEMSVVASKKYKLEKAKKKGKAGANIALSLSEKPTYFYPLFKKEVAGRATGYYSL